MINVFKKLTEQKLQAKLVLQVHDELVIDCPEEEAAIVSEILKTEMENAVTLKVPLTVEVGIGKNWFVANNFIVPQIWFHKLYHMKPNLWNIHIK